MKRGEFFGQDLGSRLLDSARVLEKRHVSGEVLPRHRHEHPYLSFVFSGGYRERSNGETTPCGPGTLIVHPSGEPHEDLFGDRPSRLLVVEPAADALGDHGRKAFDRRAVLSGPVVRRLIGTIRKELDRDDELSDLAVRGALLELAAEVLRTSSPSGDSIRPPAWLREARRIVLQRFREGLQLGALAEEIGVHPSHLAREFRRHFGTSVGELVRSARIEHALARIGSGVSLADLATECGFADQSHFSRCFANVVGTTPGVYRTTRIGRPGKVARSQPDDS